MIIALYPDQIMQVCNRLYSTFRPKTVRYRRLIFHSPMIRRFERILDYSIGSSRSRRATRR